MDDVPTRTTTAAVTPPVVRVTPDLGPTARVARGGTLRRRRSRVAPTLARAARGEQVATRRSRRSAAVGVALGRGGGREQREGADGAPRSRALLAGRDSQAAISALRRVADEFPASAYAAIAAKQLATHYAQTQPDLAKKYLDQAARKGVFSEDAMCAQMRAEDQAGHKDEASARASEYLGKHPNGRCKDDANRILAGGDADGDDEAAPGEPAPAPSASSSAAPSSSAPSAPAPPAPDPKP